MLQTEHMCQNCFTKFHFGYFEDHQDPASPAEPNEDQMMKAIIKGNHRITALEILGFDISVPHELKETHLIQRHNIRFS